jgi:hypothetical protein
MDFVANIEEPVLYWVQKMEGSASEPRLWGMPVAGTSGFGPEAREYQGVVDFISAKERWEGQLLLTQGHANSRGFFW